MSINTILAHRLVSLNKRMWRCDMQVQDFEKDFISNLLKNAKYYTKGKKIFWNIRDSCNRDIKLYFSEKQIKVFEKIELRCKDHYDNRCVYYLYNQIFEDREIILEKFDRDTLKLFKGQKVEDEESKEWLRQILYYHNL